MCVASGEGKSKGSSEEEEVKKVFAAFVWELFEEVSWDPGRNRVEGAVVMGKALFEKMIYDPQNRHPINNSLGGDCAGGYGSGYHAS